MARNHNINFARYGRNSKRIDSGEERSPDHPRLNYNTLLPLILAHYDGEFETFDHVRAEALFVPLESD